MLSAAMPDTVVSQMSCHGSTYRVLPVANQFMLKAVPSQPRPCWPDWDLSQDCGFQLLLKWLLYALCQRFLSLEPHSSSSDGLSIDQVSMACVMASHAGAGRCRCLPACMIASNETASLPPAMVNRSHDACSQSRCGQVVLVSAHSKMVDARQSSSEFR